MKQRCLKIQEYLIQNNIDAYFANTCDDFLSEYTLSENNELFQILGFSGSNGYLLVTQTENLFFTDGRYLLQAKNEIIDNCTIFHIKDFLNILQEKGFKTLALDFTRISNFFASSLEKYAVLHNINCFYAKCLVSSGKFYNLPENITGEAISAKINKVQEYLRQNKKDGYFVSNPQNVCWLLNIRGDDEHFTPIYKAKMFISCDGYFLNPNCVKGDVFVENDISFRDYNTIDGKKTFDSFLTEMKAVKNSVEIEGMINSHKIDGKILTEFLLWLEKNYNGMTEYDIGEKLLEFRKRSEFFKTPSFSTICGVNSNGAIIHYNAKKETAKKTEKNSIVLIDSGGQYADFTGKQKILGTTDVTRTIFLGENPPDEYKQIFTLVLKGHIAIATAEFDESTPASYFDGIARKYLVEKGLNYDHSTGHGVGAFLSVHEAGCGFSSKNNSPLKEGMIISNEPGCYLEGKFGIRIESLVLVCKKDSGKLCFQTLTMVPIQEKSIDCNLLNAEEMVWLKNYNNICVENLSYII